MLKENRMQWGLISSKELQWLWFVMRPLFNLGLTSTNFFQRISQSLPVIKLNLIVGLFYVPPNQIVRMGRQFSDIPRNRKIHCIKLDDENSHLLTNTRSCNCPGCCYGELDKCCNKDFLDDWQTVNIKMLSQPSDKVTRSEPSPEATRAEVSLEEHEEIMGNL